jgi:hypothetical protein
MKETRTLCGSGLFLFSASCLQLSITGYRGEEKQHGKPLSLIHAALAAGQLINSGLCHFLCGFFLPVHLASPSAKMGEASEAEGVPLLAAVSNDNLKQPLFHTPSLSCRHGPHVRDAGAMGQQDDLIFAKAAFAAALYSAHQYELYSETIGINRICVGL